MITLTTVPTEGTPKQTVRVDPTLWQAFLEASKAKGLSGAENLRRFMRREVEQHQSGRTEHRAPDTSDG